MLNKTRIIKTIIGPVLSDLGFKYIRKEYGIVWTFARQVDDVKQQAFIQQHTKDDEEYKLMFWTSAGGNGMREIGNVLPEYEEKEYWQAGTEEEFTKVMEFFASFIKNNGSEIVEDMLTEKEDSFETRERKQYFKEHRIELAQKYDSIYHILSIPSAQDQLKKIDEILWDNKDAEDTPEKQEEMYELFLGMAAIFSEIMLSIEGAEINYDKRLVTITVPKHILKVRPIYEVVQAWFHYRLYNDFSVPSVWASSRTLL